MDDFSGLDEGVTSIRLFFQRFPFFIWIASTWTAVTGSYKWLALHVDAYASGLTPSIVSPVTAAGHLSPTFVVLAVVIPYRLLWLAVACAIAVTYHRAIIDGYRPAWPFAPLNRRWAKYFVGLIFVSIALNQLARIVVGGPSAAVSTNTGQITPIIFWLLIAIASLGGLRLTAIAVEDPTVDLTGSILATRPVSLNFIGGFLISSLPFFVAGDYVIVLNPLSRDGVSDIGALGAGLVSDFLSLAAVACAAIYLSRAYQKLSPTNARFPIEYRRRSGSLDSRWYWRPRFWLSVGVVLFFGAFALLIGAIASFNDASSTIADFVALSFVLTLAGAIGMMILGVLLWLSK